MRSDKISKSCFHLAYEDFGTLIEAQSCGTPVIALEKGGIGNYKGHGFLLEFLKNKILKVLQKGFDF